MKFIKIEKENFYSKIGNRKFLTKLIEMSENPSNKITKTILKRKMIYIENT